MTSFRAPLFRVGLVGALLLSAACTRGPDFEPPAPTAPETFRSETLDGSSVANTPWWDLYEDPALRELITQGLENNRNVREAMARSRASSSCSPT